MVFKAEKCMWFIASVSLAWMSLNSTVCHGQLFGSRNVGKPLGRRAGPQSPATSNDLSTLQGTERFLRENRAERQFVGRDSSETANFVGQVNAGGQTSNVTPAIDPQVRPDLSNVINRPVPPRRPNALLEPPLVLGFQFAPETILQRDAKAQKSIGRSLSFPFGNQIAVSVVGQTANLHGVVRDEEQRRLAETIVLMEPGVSSVVNELTLQNDSHSNLPD